MGESNMNQEEAVPSVFEHLGLISTWWRGEVGGGVQLEWKVSTDFWK